MLSLSTLRGSASIVDQRKLLHQTIPKNTMKANRQIFEVISAMDDTPDKYISLLNACKEGGMKAHDFQLTKHFDRYKTKEI